MIRFERIRELREEKELTQKQISKLLGVDISTYSAWERGRDLFPLKRLLILANIFEVSIDYITGQTDQKKYDDLKEEMDLNLLKERLRLVRIENEYTQEILAKSLHTTHSALSAYENGHQIMPLITLYQFSSLVNISMDYLLGRTNYKYFEKKPLPIYI